MRIVLDARATLWGPFGIPRYARILAENLPAMDKQHEFGILVWRRQRSATAGIGDSGSMRTPILPGRALFTLNDRGIRAPSWGLGSPKVLHCPDGFPIRFHGVQTIATLHDCFWITCPDVLRPEEIETCERALRGIIAWGDHIVTVSEHSKADLVASCSLKPEQISVVYPAVDPHLLPASGPIAESPIEDKTAKPFILYVGAIEPRKNLHRLVRSFARIRTLIPHHLVIVGSSRPGPNYAAALEHECNSLALGDRLRVMGTVPDSVLRTLYAHCSLFVFPSLYEGFGLPPIEAMAWGKPVLTSNAGSLPEVAGDGALQVDPLSEEQLADAMLALLTDDALSSRLARRAVDRASFFSVDRMVRSFGALYDRIG